MAEENTTEEQAPAAEAVVETEEVVDEVEVAETTEEASPEEASIEEASDEDEAPTFHPRSSSNELSDSLVSQLPTVEGEETPRKEVEGGRAYEIIYIVRTSDPEWVEKAIESVRNIIESDGGAVDNVRASEARRLAYPIEKQTEGIYVVTNARFAGNVSAELERYFRIEESVLRSMVLREDD
ncbi:MAG: 30S ribosomal protein S6 [Abditibacteriaceae bacterium]